MTKEELEKEVRKYLKKTFHHEYYDDVVMVMGFAEPREKRIAELEELLINSKRLSDTIEKAQKKQIAELQAQIEKLIDFVLSKTECCDVCPITDTCINSEGTCPYAGILAKGEEEVTREWLMQFISKEIKENE